MLIGILSDTHDQLFSAIAGMNLLQQAGAEFFIHCGDVGSEQIIDLLAGLKSALVWGNNDWDRKPLTQYAESLGITVLPQGGEIELDGKKFIVMHGDEPRLIQQAINFQKHDYLLMGHSHVRSDKRAGKLRMINPGALHRANPKSVATLNTATDELKFLLLTEARA